MYARVLFLDPLAISRPESSLGVDAAGEKGVCSRGKVLTRFVELRKEICEFLTDKGKDMAVFTHKQWLADVAFLTDIT